MPEIEEGQARVALPFTRGRLKRSSLVLPVYVIAVFGLWEAGVRLSGIASFILPAPSAVLAALASNLTLLIEHSAITIFEAVAGLLLALVTGVVLAVTVSYWSWARLTVLPTVIALGSVPKVAVAPLLVVWFGFGVESKIATVVVIAFFPIFMNTARGLSAVDPDYIDLMLGMRANPRAVFTKVRLPWAVPYLFTGLRIAVPLAMIGAVIGEFVTARSGLGYIILSTSQNLRTDLTFAAIVVVTIWSAAIYRALLLSEQMLQRRFPAAPVA